MDNVHSFFTALDRELDQQAKAMRNRVFSLYRDMPWTAEDYRQLQPVIQGELERFVQSLLEIFDNIGGGKVPENVLGYQISVILKVDVDEDVLEGGDATDIRHDQRDYADLWAEFLLQKHESASTRTREGESAI
jgi:hypothetical protein